MKILIHTTDAAQTISPALHSHFVEFLGSCIYDGIWVGEDSPIPNYDGLRKDTVDAFRELEPPVIRWPGGCYADTYHWRNAIGPREGRPVTYNENFGTMTLDSNHFGTEEFMHFCELVGAKAWLNTNLMTGSVEEMRDWMEYCSREEPTSLARERAANGHPAPYQVPYWGIGNEAWAGGGNYTAGSYADAYRRYASSVPRFHGEPMKLIASGPDGNKPEERVRWTKEFFSSMADFRQPPMDGFDLHFYNWNLASESDTETRFDRNDWDRVIEGAKELEEVILEQYDLVAEGVALWNENGKDDPFHREAHVELVVGEWGNWHRTAFAARPALYQQCSMRDALTTALTLDIFHRNADKLSLACVAQSVNVLNSLFLTDGESFLKTPNFDVFLMYKVHRGAKIAGLTVESEDSQVLSFASVKENLLAVNLINTSYDEERSVTLSPDVKAVYRSGLLLASARPQDANTFEQPDLIRRKEAPSPTVTEEGFTVTLPAASVQTLIFTI